MPILLFTGVEESSSLMSNSFQEMSHFTPFAVTIHVQQMSSKFPHQPVSPTSTNIHARLIQSLARNHSVLEDCSPVALQQKADQTSSCRCHERSFSPFFLYCVLYSNPYTGIHQAPILRPVSFFLERSLSTHSSILGKNFPSTFSIEKVF